MKLAILAMLSGAALSAQVAITRQANGVRIDIDGKPFTEFLVSGPTITKPILWPVRAASGTVITRGWPIAPVPGEPHDHQHQKGLWFGHSVVNGVNFWANEADYKEENRGNIVLKDIASAEGGKKSGFIAASFTWQDLKGKVLLDETRNMTFYSEPNLRIVDFDITLTAKDKVVFGDDKDGLFAIRLRPELQEDKGTGHIVNSDGLETEKNAWGKPANWVDYYGQVKGEKVGIAMFDHPSNPRHPTRWHVRAYGLFAANPFALGMFTGNKSDDGSMTLEAGQILRFRYRVVIHPGDEKTAHIADLYNSYVKGSQ